MICGLQPRKLRQKEVKGLVGHHESESENEVAQLCLTLCNLVDYDLSGSSIQGIFQARVPEWVALW